MSTQTQSDLQNEEMYAIEFCDFELSGYEPEAEDEEIENEYRCPVCESHELQYMMHYPLSADDATTELYQCAQCGAMGEADDCRINPPALGWRQAGTLPPAAPAARKPAQVEDDMERARRYGKGDQEVAA
jgi:rubredoxin